MRSLLGVVLMVVLLTCRAWAQEDDFSSATSALQDVLSNLKQSVEKLSLDNDQLAARDNAVKDQVLQLQTQLGQLEAQGDILNKAAAKLQDNNPGRAQQITLLEEEALSWDMHVQKSEAGIKSIQQSLEAGYQEEEKVLSPQSPAESHREKEKSKLMAMINESQQRQDALKAAILEFHKKIPSQPVDRALSPVVDTGHSSQWDGKQLHQLEAELTDVQYNYSQLKSLMELMHKKSKAVRMTVSEGIEEKKLQGNINDLNRQGLKLRADLDDLRLQMVDLDKRKSRLEMTIRQMR